MSEKHQSDATEAASTTPSEPAPSANLTRALFLPVVVFLVVPIVLSLVVKYLFGL